MIAPQDLVKQISLMNRVHAALSSSLKSDDVHAIVLATLTSPSGLNFQRALLFLYDAQADRLRGHMAMGPANAEEAAERLAEYEAETHALNQMAAMMADDEDSGVGAFGALGISEKRSLLDLRDSSYWITMLQQYGPDSELTKRVRHVEHVKRTTAEELREGNKPRLIDFVLERQSRAFKKADLRLSAPMEETLADEFAIVPLRAGDGPRGLVVLDRRFAPDGDSIGPDQLQLLDWFATQATLALANAELFSSLQRAYDDMKEVDKLKSNFLSTVSHELRTPLTAINGFVQLLVDGRVGALTPPQQNLLDRVRVQGTHMANMVNDLIEITEFQMGGLDEVELEEVDPLTCFFNVLPRLDPRRRDKKIDIEPVVDAGVPSIKSNGRALERIYYHLLDNAVKFIESAGSVRVVFRPELDKGLLRIDIKDTGIGIPPDNLKSIFDNFYQVDNNLTRGYNGMGLGLTITKILLESTRGSIHVESVPGQGSSFTISYPLWREEGVDARGPQRPA